MASLDGSDIEGAEPDAQRRRIEPPPPNLVPINSAMLVSNEILTFKNHCTLRDINESQINSRVRTGKRFLDFQLLRIVLMSPSQPNVLYNRGPTKRGGGTESQGKGRMFLCRVFDQRDSDASGELVYFVQGENNTNKNLFLRENKWRDDGTLTIGTYFRVLAPEYITQYLNNEVPMIVTTRPAILMKRPQSVPKVNIRSLSVNQSRAYVLTNAHLFVKQVEPADAVCNGNLCDKQRIRQIRSGKCGCYHFQSISKAGVIFNHSIVVTPRDGTVAEVQSEITERTFTSQKFSQLYITKPMPNNVTLSQIMDSVEMDMISDKVERLSDYVNDHGGWTVVGWYRLGMVTDKALVEENQKMFRDQREVDTQVEAGETKFHIVSLYPSRETFTTVGHDDYNYLVRNRIDTENISF